LRGGLFVEGTFGLAAFLRTCAVNFYVPDASGDRKFADKTYAAYSGDFFLTATAMPETANFGDGPRVGEVMEIRVSGAPVSYAEWVLRSSVAATGLVSATFPVPSDDLGSCGVDNLFRYALNLGPDDNPAGRLPHLTLSDESPSYSFYLDPGKLDLVYRVEASSDLVDWSRVLFDSSTRDFTGWNNGWLTIIDDSSIGGTSAPTPFYRLRITLTDD